MTSTATTVPARSGTAPARSPDLALLLTVSGDIHLKSARTQKRLRRTLQQNLEAALARHAPGAHVVKAPRGRMMVTAPDPATLDRAATAAASVFGIYRVVQVRRLDASSLDGLVRAVAEAAAPLVAGRTFAARVRRRGTHGWSSIDAERAIGAALLPHAAKVDLTAPDVEVRTEVYGDEAWFVERTWHGADGLPLGTQEPILAMLSGGFDSPVAAWMMMRRGSPVDFVHLMMDCSQSDHALAVAYGLWERWGTGHDAVAWVIDFTDVKEALLERVDSQHRQVVLKQLMIAAADAVAGRHRYPAIVTGDSVGQVSTQTIANLAMIDQACDRTVLRPLAGLTKDEILEWSRRTGSHDLSARAREVCDLSDGPVEVAARRGRLERAVARLPGDVLSVAVSERKVIRLADWFPGCELVPVVSDVPPGAALVRPGDDVPPTGALALRGRGAAEAASRLAAAGRHVHVVEEPIEVHLPLQG